MPFKGHQEQKKKRPGARMDETRRSKINGSAENKTRPGPTQTRKTSKAGSGRSRKD